LTLSLFPLFFFFNNRPDRKDLPGLGVQKEKTQTRR
jgi:hypothetical protein